MVYLRFPYPEDVQRILMRIGIRVGVDILPTLVRPSPEHEQVDEWLPKYNALRRPQEFPVRQAESPEEKMYWKIFFILFVGGILLSIGIYFFWLSTWHPSPTLNL